MSLEKRMPGSEQMREDLAQYDELQFQLALTKKVGEYSRLFERWKSGDETMSDEEKSRIMELSDELAKLQEQLKN